MSGEELDALIARVEKASGPDREMDAEICRYLAGSPTDHWYDLFGDMHTDNTIPEVTASIDAALALAERRFGLDAESMLYNYDLGWHASAWAQMAFTADLHLAVGTPPLMQEFHGQAPTLPLAIVLALLRALKAQP